MDNKTFELSSRYYLAEVTVWVLGAVLVLHTFLGINLDQPLPFLNIKLQNQVYFPHIVSVILFAVLLYLFLEYKQSHEKAKDSLLTYSRVIATTLWAIIAFFVIHPDLVKNTAYEGFSPFWYLAFLGVGFLLGLFANMLIFSTLVIRNMKESNTLNLPRVPRAARIHYFFSGSMFILLLGAYFTLYFLSPGPIVGIASLLTLLAFLYLVFGQYVSFFFYRDKNGKKVSYKQRISDFREIHATHDRMHDLIDFAESMNADDGINSSSQPKDIQKKVRNYFDNEESQSSDFHVQLLEEIQLSFYAKDGNTDNSADENCGFKIRKEQGDKDKIHVLFKPADSVKDDVELFIQINKVQEYAEGYIAATAENTEPDLTKILSKAINDTVLDELIENRGALLPAAAMSGDIDSVKELIRLEHDVNAIGEAGWTALISAAAQGDLKIIKILLNAGANPDISNLLGITPLIYGARYGNIEVVKMLVDYGAEINLCDKYGDSALMLATRIGHIKIVDLLIQSGADIALRNHKKKNALDIAYKYGHGKIAKKLRNTKKST